MSNRTRRAPRQLDAEGLFELAVRSLAGRACSSGEMRQKLRARAVRTEDVDTTIARLKEYGYLDDRRFAESFTAARLENQGFGKTRVSQELRRRRVAPALAETTVRKAYENVDEVALIEDYIRRKYRSKPREALFREEKDLASAYRRLMRAGFASANAIRALKRFAANPDLLDAFEPPPAAEEE